jgi:hypothetical protein
MEVAPAGREHEEHEATADQQAADELAGASGQLHQRAEQERQPADRSERFSELGQPDPRVVLDDELEQSHAAMIEAASDVAR